MAAKPVPLGDATNMDACMKDKIVRKHTRFDEEGNACETVETEIEASVPPASEEKEVQAAETQGEAGEGAAEDEENAGEEEEEAAEASAEEAAKMAYREVPSLFCTEKERTAKWSGTHIRFPEDDDGENEEPAAPVSAELQAKIDDLGSAVTTAMVVDQKS
jgi:hypothetical protein